MIKHDAGDDKIRKIINNNNYYYFVFNFILSNYRNNILVYLYFLFNALKYYNIKMI